MVRGEIMKIGIVGQGYVGTAVKEVFSKHYNVETYDLDKAKCSVDYLEEIVERLVNLEKKVLDHETQFNHVPIWPDENDPLKDFPEVTQW